MTIMRFRRAALLVVGMVLVGAGCSRQYRVKLPGATATFPCRPDYEQGPADSGRAGRVKERFVCTDERTRAEYSIESEEMGYPPQVIYSAVGMIVKRMGGDRVTFRNSSGPLEYDEVFDGYTESFRLVADGRRVYRLEVAHAGPLTQSHRAFLADGLRLESK
jgi:hypothetical protein